MLEIRVSLFRVVLKHSSCEIETRFSASTSMIHCRILIGKMINFLDLHLLYSISSRRSFAIASSNNIHFSHWSSNLAKISSYLSTMTKRFP